MSSTTAIAPSPASAPAPAPASTITAAAGTPAPAPAPTPGLPPITTTGMTATTAGRYPKPPPTPALNRGSLAAPIFSIGGIDVTNAATPRDETHLSTVATYPMAARLQLSLDDKQTLLTNAAAYDRYGHVKKFRLADELTQELQTSPNPHLVESGNIDSLIQAMASRFQTYDMYNVFQYTFLWPRGTTDHDITTCTHKNLITHYMSIAEQDVAYSCEWYLRHCQTANPAYIQVFTDNLHYTYKYLENHTSKRLHDKVYTRDTGYERRYRGGPLYFKIMMSILQQDSHTHVRLLNSDIKKLNIASYPSEDISKVAARIRNAHLVMKNFKDADNKDLVPSEDFASNVLTSMKTSSCSQFTTFVERADLDLFSLQRDTPTATFDVEQFLSLAVSYYTHLKSRGVWVAYADIPRAAAFSATDTSSINPTAPHKCFNCGEPGCRPSKCPQPRDEARIQRNRAAFKAARNAATGGSGQSNATPTGKWKPPTAAEKKYFDGRRIIDETLMYYHYPTKRWKPVDQPDSPNDAVASDSHSTAAAASSPGAPHHVNGTDASTAPAAHAAAPSSASVASIHSLAPRHQAAFHTISDFLRGGT